MVEIRQPMRNEDGFEYTENFDGKQVFFLYDNHTINLFKITVWVNMKSCVGNGGSQTRTLRDQCYTFVEAQLNYLLSMYSMNTMNTMNSMNTMNTFCYFANVLDGDECSKRMKMFHYLKSLPEYSKVEKYVYVGDLKGYLQWVHEFNK